MQNKVNISNLAIAAALEDCTEHRTRSRVARNSHRIAWLARMRAAKLAGEPPVPVPSMLAICPTSDGVKI